MDPAKSGNATFVPVDHDPLASPAAPPKADAKVPPADLIWVPVDHDPFAVPAAPQAARPTSGAVPQFEAGTVSLVPVDHNPFAASSLKGGENPMVGGIIVQVALIILAASIPSVIIYDWLYSRNGNRNWGEYLISSVRFILKIIKNLLKYLSMAAGAVIAIYIFHLLIDLTSAGTWIGIAAVVIISIFSRKLEILDSKIDKIRSELHNVGNSKDGRFG